jgi:hypothetical protein
MSHTPTKIFNTTTDTTYSGWKKNFTIGAAKKKPIMAAKAYAMK